jgi:putative membrane protein
MSVKEQAGFWRQAVTLHGSVLPHTFLHILFLGVLAFVLTLAAESIEQRYQVTIAVALEIGRLLRQGGDVYGMSGFALLRLEQARAALLEHVGSCDRIRSTPLPSIYVITIRRFIAVFLITLPFALLHKTEKDWLVPIVTMGVAYALLALDQIAVELQNPFSTAHVGHLPLDEFCATIEHDVFQLATSPAGKEDPHRE